MKNQERSKVLLVAQEITFARALSSNDKFLRDRALRRLKKWLSDKSAKSEPFTEEGFMRLWKGLFYCVWMSDKPLVQEAVVEEISNLVHCFTKFSNAQVFMRCFYQAMSQAWFGIDQHRLDKYMMLVRRCLRQIFEVLKKKGWKKKQLSLFAEDMYKALVMAPVGMNLHLIDIYLEELSKVGQGELRPDVVSSCVAPFARYMSEITDARVISNITKNIFLYLMRQSDLGIKHRLKFQAWRQLGFPGGSIDVMEEVEPEMTEDNEKMEEDDMGEEKEGALDPRAGNVDVLLPPISFKPESMIKLLKQQLAEKETTTKARKSISSLIKKFSSFKAGVYPLGLRKVDLPSEDVDEEEFINEAVERLQQELENIETDNSKREKPKNVDVWEVSDFNAEEVKKNKSIKLHGNWNITPLKESCLNKRKGKDSISPSLKSEQTSTPKNTPQSKKLKAHRNNGSVTNSVTNGEEFGSPLGKNLKRKMRSNESEVSSESKKGSFLNENAIVAIAHNKSTNNDSKVHEPLLAPLPDTPKVQLEEPELKKLKTPSSHSTKISSSATSTPGSAKKVAFVLNRNMAQEEGEYKKNLKKRPSLPFDADKRPAQGVLKSANVNSPINPFYRCGVK